MNLNIPFQYFCRSCVFDKYKQESILYPNPNANLKYTKLYETKRNIPFLAQR